MSSDRWLIGITGGSGFIGSSIAKNLNNFFNVKLLDIKPPVQSLDDGVSFRICDVRNFKEVKKSLEDVDLVIHAAILQIPDINERAKLGYEVNFLGTQNVCKAVDEITRIKGMILAGSWHTIGIKELRGVINEEFGFRPDKVENRAKLYNLSKVAQEIAVRFYDEMSEKVFGVIRMGTVLGEGMPKSTAANIFIEKGLKGEPITPFKHSMYRPMVYVSVGDVCRAFENFSRKILSVEVREKRNSLAHVFNVYYPEAITILELAEIIRDTIIKYSDIKKGTEIKIVDRGQPILFKEENKYKIKIDISRAINILQLGKLKSPKESIEEIIRGRIDKRC